MYPLVAVGLLYGFLATIPMTLFELFPYTAFGLEGVFEWHENRSILKKLSVNHGKAGILFLHFLNGSIAAIPYPFILGYLNVSSTSERFLFSIAYGLVVWLATLYPIHKPLTGMDPFRHPLGKKPLLYSIAGHVIYGVGLGVVSSWLV